MSCTSKKADTGPFWIILTIILALLFLLWLFFYSASLKDKMMETVKNFFGGFL